MTPQTTVRLPADLYEWVRAEAYRTRKSQNEIIVGAVEARRSAVADEPEGARK